ncbi:MAG: glycosyltransferase [Nitrososphaerales archaeon]
MIEYTGERFIPWMEGAQIHYEHLHRYGFVTKFLNKKKVLDLGCGEGYGCLMFAEVAEDVVGLDMDKETIEHARQAYRKDNLKFVLGSFLEIPIKGKEKFDVITCFESLEHVSEHDRMLAEVKRLLKKDGLFIASTPNKLTYCDIPEYKNPFHMKELYLDQFEDLLKKHFRNKLIFGQRVYTGSNIWFLASTTHAREFIIKKGEKGFNFLSDDAKSPLYHIAICSDKQLKSRDYEVNSYLIDISDWLIRDLARQIEGLQTELKNQGIGSDPMRALLSLYYSREDLHNAFPEVTNGDYKRLIEWAKGACDASHKEDENTRNMLLSFSSWYAEQLRANERKELTEQLSHTLAQIKAELESKDNLSRQKTEEVSRLESELAQIKAELESKDNLSRQKTEEVSRLESEVSRLESELSSFRPTAWQDPAEVLIKVYRSRKDLSERFPEAASGDLERLIKWAAGVVLGQYKDNEYDLLRHYGAWYVDRSYKQEIQKPASVAEYNSKMHETLPASSPEELKKTVATSRRIIATRGFREFCRQALQKIKRREFRIIDAKVESRLQHTLKEDSKEISYHHPTAATMKSIEHKPYEFSEQQRYLVQNILSHLEYQPMITIIMPVYDAEKVWLERAISSVLKQLYEKWELCIVDDASTKPHIKNVLETYAAVDKRIKIRYLEKNQNISVASNEALKLASGEFVTFVDHDDEITEDALYEAVKILNLHNDADIIYSDDAKIDEKDNIYDYQFKPCWSTELLLSYCYFSHLTIIRKRIVDDVGGFRVGYEGAQDYDLILRATENTDKIYHIPKVLYYWRAVRTSTAHSADTKGLSIERGRMAVQDALTRRGIKGNVIVPEFVQKTRLGIYKINFELLRKPKVSIIIPSKDRVDLLRKCVESIEKKLTYKNYEIIIVDTGSEEKETLEYLREVEHKVISIKMDKFNFSKANNVAVLRAKGEYVLLMNNDIEINYPNLLEEMLGYMESDVNIAAVGAKLLYTDGRVQHAGVVLGLNNGLAGHANKLRGDSDPGYLWYASVARNYSAVTAALMMVRKKYYMDVGGMDEENLAVAYGDVDLCLKMIDKGYRIVFNPYASAYHHEGSTRGSGKGRDDPKEESFLRNKWYHVIRKDPFYNPNLSLEDGSFIIKQNHMSKKLLFISHNLNHEGAPLSMYYLACELKERGYLATVLSPVDGPLKRYYFDEQIDVVIEPAFYSDSPDGNIDFFKQFDFIHVNTILNFRFLDLAKKAGVPTVWSIRESEREHYTQYGVNKTQFAIADNVLFVSNATRKVYSDLETNNKFITIPNGLDVKEIESFKTRNKKNDLRKKYDFAKDDIIVTIIGTVTERKGQMTFVEAAVNLLKKNSNNLHFLVVGTREGNYLEKLKQIINENDCSSNIHLIPETADAFSYYLISDIFVCCSFVESFPRVTLEAMAFELPIIATNVYGIPEQIQDGVHGILIPPGDPQLLVEKIWYLLSNPEIAKGYARDAYERVKSAFTLENMVDKYERLIEVAAERNS